MNIVSSLDSIIYTFAVVELPLYGKIYAHGVMTSYLSLVSLFFRFDALLIL